MTEPVRLAKRVIELTQCSRREAEQYIEGGWVLVDGAVVEAPQFMVTTQQVALHPGATLAPVEPATLMLHKPATDEAADALVTPATHWPEDGSGIRPLRRHLMRLVAPMALPANASGLLVFTQDGRVARRLGEDVDLIEQEFIVDVAGEIKSDGLALLNHGLRFNHYALPPIKVSWQSERRLRFAFKILQPERIGQMCQAVGLDVLAMKRIRLGRLPMAKLPVGQWRYLAPHEKV